MSSKCNCCNCCNSDVSSNCKSCEPNNDIRIETCAGYGFTTNRCNCACPPQPPKRPLYSSIPCGCCCNHPGIQPRRRHTHTCGCCNECECNNNCGCNNQCGCNNNCGCNNQCGCNNNCSCGCECECRPAPQPRRRHHKECGCTNFGSPCPNTTTWGRCE